MVERSISLAAPGPDISALKETLRAQQELLQTLYAELDIEREASATAASEALSMILRLQGEKAALALEASQYKRMAEEKMCHAETSLALFEELIYQKEMEIASLEFQVQAYRCKLISLGFTDLGNGENRFPENLILQSNEGITGEMGAGESIRRLHSLPALLLNDFTDKKSPSEGEKLVISMSEFCPDKGVIDQSLDSKKSYGASPGRDLNSYWEQIRKLDERVREISDIKNAGGNKYAMSKRDNRPRLLRSQVSTSILESARGEITSTLEKVKNSEKLSKREVTDPACSSNVYDVFEVPQAEDRRTSSNEKKGQRKHGFEGKNRLGKPDLVMEEIFERNVRDETESLKTVLLSKNHEKRLYKPPRDGISPECKKDLARQTQSSAGYQAELQQLSQRIEQLEQKRTSVKPEINEGGEEELSLLKEIREQLNSIQAEMTSWRKKKSPPRDDSALLPVKEAMLYFWF